MVEGGVQPYIYNWDNNQINRQAFNLSATSYTVTVTDSRGCKNQFTETLASPIPIQLMTTSTPAACVQSASGTAEVTVEGGTAPFTFLWNDTIAQTSRIANNLPPATYQVRVEDALGCQDTATVGIGVMDSINYTKLITPVSCVGVQDGVALSLIHI